MKKIFLLLLLSVFSCATIKNKPKKATIDDLKKKNDLWGIKDNSYFYFMIDSSGNKHLVKTSMFNATKVIWVEKLNKR